MLSGLGRVGKTSVAIEFVYRHQADYDLIVQDECAHPNLDRRLLFPLALSSPPYSLRDLFILLQGERDVVTRTPWRLGP